MSHQTKKHKFEPKAGTLAFPDCERSEQWRMKRLSEVFIDHSAAHFYPCRNTTIPKICRISLPSPPITNIYSKSKVRFYAAVVVKEKFERLSCLGGWPMNTSTAPYT
jgi:hypothetical protein